MNERILLHQEFGVLTELALDVHWSWNHRGDNLWRQLDPDLWELTHNPWLVLQTVSRERLDALFADTDFNRLVEELLQKKKQTQNDVTWFQKHKDSSLTCIAYFSMEFMLSEALPIYSGGLGNVAGDQLKSASDLGVPVVAVGLLYQQGYFRQIIDKDGNQHAVYPYNDPGQLPISPVRKANGEWLRIEIKVPGWPIWVRVWEVQVGRAKLYLLDSNDPANYPAHRGITAELYGGGSEMRLKQEMLLGICGWRIFEELNISPEVCHLNEGHAAFAVLERARCFMLSAGVNFEIALTATRPGNLFTTHTAVTAGFDLFSPELIEQHLEVYAKEQLKIPLSDLLALGRQNPENTSEPFNMAFLAARGSGAINGVSCLHASVSQSIFSPLFPHWPTNEVPIGYVTNGVHMPSWDSMGADELWTNACGKDRWLDNVDTLHTKIKNIPDNSLWQMRNQERSNLIDYARKRLSRQLAASGACMNDIEHAQHLFEPSILTLGFARRFASYKRPNLLLHDPERLLRILTNPLRPVQLIIAGKAHPADIPGQAMIKEWINFIRNSAARAHVIFIADYDMQLTEQLVAGVDVWINTPRRPWEACGTSGMKVLVNGGLNLSELDGWWAEAYKPELGWAIGDGQKHDDIRHLDEVEAEALYNILENQVIPEFYSRDGKGIPTHWINRVRESMAQLTPQFSANRAVRQYTQQYYLPAAKAFIERSKNKGELAKNILRIKDNLKKNWWKLRFGEVKIELKQNNYIFDVRLYIDDIDSADLSVEIYADSLGNLPLIRQKLQDNGPTEGDPKTHIFKGSVPADRPCFHLTPRVVSKQINLVVPLEIDLILWQK